MVLLALLLLPVGGGCAGGAGPEPISGIYVSNVGLIDIVEVHIADAIYPHAILPEGSRFYELDPGLYVVDVIFSDGSTLRPEGSQIPPDPVEVRERLPVWVDFTE